MNIGIFEKDHFEGAYPVIRLFDDGHNRITIFTNQKSFRQFSFLFGEQVNDYHWVIQENGESIYRYLFKVYRHLKKNKPDLLYLNTISDNHVLYARMIKRLPGMRVVLTLHDINNFFQPSPLPGFRQWVRRRGKMELYKIIREFNVVSATMVEYLRSHLSADTRVHCVPGAVFDPSRFHPLSLKTGEIIRIVVPGTIDRRRRDYAQVLELLDLINSAKIPVSVTLLGGISVEYSGDLASLFQKYQEKYSNLHFYRAGLVDQPEFDEVMNRSHFIFIPSKIETVMADGIPETYGLTKSSGNIFDVIKHARPFFAPTRLRIDPILEGACHAYTGVAEIASSLDHLSKNPDEYGVMLEKAYAASCLFLPERIRERNQDLFHSSDFAQMHF